MPPGKSAGQKPRELRRRVMVPARVRHGGSWADACILNISSRGLLVHSGRPIPRGTDIEIWRGDHVIVARVVWGEGGRTGLQAHERLPIDEIMILSPSPSLQLTAASRKQRHGRRMEDHSRLRGRTIEFVGVVVIAASLAGVGLTMVETAFARPLVLVAAALGT
jgi:hypothetical protein